MCRTCGCPACCTPASCAVPAKARGKPVDFDAVAKMPGVVQVVRDGGFTAVLATQEWQAVKALQRLQSAGWDRPGAELPAEDMREAIRRCRRSEVPIFDYPGPPAPSDGKVVKARYSRPCLMHGSIGPSCAVALWENDGVTVWTHSQGVYPLRKSLAELLAPAARQGALHPYRGLGLLRPQWRRRCRRRRSPRRPRGPRPSGAPAMDARAGAWLGAARLGDGGRAGGHAGRRPHRRLAPRRLEQCA